MILLLSTFQNFETRLNKIDDLLEYARINPELAKEETTYLENLQSQKAKLQQDISEQLSQIGTVKCLLPNRENLIHTINKSKQAAGSEYVYNIKP